MNMREDKAVAVAGMDTLHDVMGTRGCEVVM